MADVLMRQCDVFSNPSERPNANVPFVIVLQSDLIFQTTTVVVAPLVRADRLREDQVLYPVFIIDGQRVALSITEVTTLPRRALKNHIANIEGERHRVVRAIDLLFTDV
jgi:toxin CcdB